MSNKNQINEEQNPWKLASSVCLKDAAMSNDGWKETTGKGNCHIWTAMGDLGTRIVELGSREEMEARWPALVAAFPDAWMTESQHVSRTRTLKGVAK